MSRFITSALRAVTATPRPITAALRPITASLYRLPTLALLPALALLSSCSQSPEPASLIVRDAEVDLTVVGGNIVYER